ncbi:AAA family ATPase [Dyella japonica]|uniref:AAA family ATPase n=1 Tax=Dyella japonica TaxID=231455 RepID=UPI0002F19A37|nr:AAA family ATPase [Dyella japonica]
MGALNPTDVFTPRAASVNPKTYISRPDLEKGLRRSLDVPKHVVIHGESGSGKSWLYKKVLGELSYHIEIANMGLCATAGSIAEVLLQTICRESMAERTTLRELGGGVPGFVSGSVKSQDKSVYSVDPFHSALESISTRAQNKPACLVFDNLEQVLQSESLIRELAGLLLLVDDERYARHQVKILLVGTSNEVRKLISGSSFSGTIANRLTEIPEVARLDEAQARELVHTGFIELLKFEYSPDGLAYADRFWRQISYHSDRIPQFMHELCLHIAWAVEDRNGEISAAAFVEGTKDWVKASLVKDIARIEPNLNAKATKIGRRNQILYCLGACHKYDFGRADIEDILGKEFPKSSGGRILNVAQILSDLAGGEHPVITRSPKSNFYRFLDPKFRIVVRWLLIKNSSTEEIVLNDFDNAISLWSKTV